MKLPISTLALAAGALAIQMLPCQSGVSMRATTMIGSVGQACEPFQCLPNQTLASLGEAVHLDVFAKVGSAYVLFAGLPVVGCQPVVGVAGELGLWSPIVIVEIGSIVASDSFPSCYSAYARTQFVIPANAPLGVQIRLQLLGESDSGGGLAFSRAVEVHTR